MLVWLKVLEIIRGDIMIVEWLVNFSLTLLNGLFNMLNVINIPHEMINVLFDILQYGVWVMGADMVAICISSLVLWYGAKSSIGIAVWLYDRIPFIH